MKLERYAIVILALLILVLVISPASAATAMRTIACTGQHYTERHSDSANWTIETQTDTSAGNIGGTRFGVVSGTTSGYYHYHRMAVLKWNTSEIPDDAVIEQVTFRARVTAKYDQFAQSPGFNIVTAPPEYLASGWVTATCYNHLYSTEDVYMRCYFSDYTAGNWYYFALPTTVINITGTSGVGLVLDWVTDNTPPTWASGKMAYMDFGAYTDYPIDLIVSYYSDSEGYPTPAPTPTPTMTTATPTPTATATPTPIPKVAVISANVKTGAVPLEVAFKDKSVGFSETYPYPTYYFDTDDTDTYSGDRQYTGEYWYHTYETPGTYTVLYNITEGGIVYSDTETITVTNATSNYYVQVHGLNTQPIDGANVSIWYDGAYQGSEGTSALGKAYFHIPYLRMVNGTITHPGYQEAYFSQYINTWDTWTSVTLYTDSETPGSGDAYGNLILTFRDAKTSAIIPNVDVKIYSDSGRTALFSSDYTISGVYTALVPLNTTYYYKASAGTYYDYTFSSEITTSPTYATHYMIKKSVASDIDGDGIPDGYDDDMDGDGIPNEVDDDIDGDGIDNDEDETPEGSGEVLLPNLNIWVYSTTGAPISGAIVSVESSMDSETHTTNTTGFVRHFCDELISGQYRIYDVSVSRGGYIGESATVNVSTQNPSVTFYLEPTSGATATPTPTVIYTPVVLPSWSGSNGTPGTYKEQFLNFTMSQFGVDQFSAGILIGLVITLLSAVFVGGCLAGYGAGGNSAGIGAMIGGAFGWVASGMLGFIPLWALIVTIALVAMIFFIFLRGGGSGGG